MSLLSPPARHYPKVGARGPPDPAKKSVFGLVWRQSRHTKPKTLESRRGAAPPVPVKGKKLPALPHQDAVQLWVMISPSGEGGRGGQKMCSYRMHRIGMRYSPSPNMGEGAGG